MKYLLNILPIVILSQFGLAQTPKVEIQYLANEGVLIKAGNKELLIDAAFQKEFEYLDVLPDTELAKIKNAKSPYDGIDLILATHVHGDHFNANMVGEHLMQNKNALFLGPNETVTHLKENFPEFQAISSRVKFETPDFNESQTVLLKGIEIKVLRLEHLGTSPWKEAENVAYLITIEGKKIIHFGDGKLDGKNLEKFNLPEENIDIAILPFWQLGPAEQKKNIDNFIAAKQILAAHIPPSNHSDAQVSIESLGYKNVIVLTEQFRSMTIH
uniref:MBL fold metallo-hydrolase n=1 Tax=Fulvivirga sp. TaxID=1931237 RepID=UPI00404A849B